MAVYKATNWIDDEDITARKLNQMSQNDQFLLDRIPRMFFDGRNGSPRRNINIKVAAGIAFLPRQTARQGNINVYFRNYFSPGCKPVIVAQPASAANFRIFCTIKQIGTNRGDPTERGFAIVLNADPLAKTTNYFPNVTDVHWIAIGW